MPGRALVVGDLNHDGHLDLIAAFQRWGVHIYHGDGRGGWKASSAGLKVLKHASAGVALGDLDGDGNLDIVAGGNTTGDVLAPGAGERAADQRPIGTA